MPKLEVDYAIQRGNYAQFICVPILLEPFHNVVYCGGFIQ